MARLHRRQQRRHGHADGAAGAPPGRAAGGRLQHEHLRRGPLSRRRTARVGARPPSGRSSSSSEDSGSCATRTGRPLVPVADARRRRPARSRRSTRCPSTIRSGCALIIGRAYGIPTVALRFFNIYGPRQALSNPYTGVLAIFASRLLNDAPPVINRGRPSAPRLRERSRRGRACRLALETPEADGGGAQHRQRPSLTRAARWRSASARVLGQRPIAPEITGQYRVGDIRHCFADISRARQLLGLRAAGRASTRARRAGRLARRPGRRGPRRRGARRAGRRGGWRCERGRRTRRRSITGGAGFIGSQPRRSAAPRRRAGDRLRQPLARRRRAQRRWLQRAPRRARRARRGDVRDRARGCARPSAARATSSTSPRRWR